MQHVLKPCLKSGSGPSSTSYPLSNRPPIPYSHQDSMPCEPLARSSSFIHNNSALPYAQPFVHFPPSPVLTSTFVVDPPRLYDRTPIVVSENDCALPQRGCPGRTYTLRQQQHSPGNHAHPSALKNRELDAYPFPGTNGFFLPSLTSDEGSSEESDGLVSPPSEYSNSYLQSTSAFCHPLCTPDYHSCLCRAAFGGDGNQQQHSSMFLPHPPSPRSSKYSYSSSSLPSAPPSRKTRIRAPPPSFGSSWDSSSSCLEGF